MGVLYKAIWISSGSGQTRKQRASGSYEYYLPTKLSCINIALDPDVAGDISRAELAIEQLNNKALVLHNTEGLARLLLRAEAVSSSHIEGLTIGTRRLLKAELNAQKSATFKFDEKAASVLGNISAMECAINQASSEKLIDVSTILNIHRALCENTRIQQFGGCVRDVQNWVGGNSYNPLQAEFVPPAPEHVEGLLEDLAAYCNNTLASVVLQAALVHAQFETIHPFIDGNGRTGRALIHLILKRRGLAKNFVPPISLCMATHAQDYVQGLSAFRYIDGGDSKKIQDNINDWLSFFSGCCILACNEVEEFEKTVAVMQDAWRKKIGSVRKGSALEVLLDEVIGAPIFTIGSICDATGRAFSAVSGAVERCVDAGIVLPVNANKRNRAFEVPSVIEKFNMFERKLASPAGNTAVEKPVRAVPEKIVHK